MPMTPLQPTTSTASTVAQDYLKLIWSAQEGGREGVSVNDLARRTRVVASTASENVRRLVDQGLVDHRPYQKVHLTEAGRAVAVGMIRRHRILETYLHDMLGFDWDEVHEEAEILEHAVSDRLLDRLDAALGRPTRDPHGDPIPSADGTVRAPVTVTLADLPLRVRARVARVSDRDPQVMRDLEEEGIGLDVVVEVTGRSTTTVDPGETIHTVEVGGAWACSLHHSHAQAPHVEVLGL